DPRAARSMRAISFSCSSFLYFRNRSSDVEDGAGPLLTVLRVVFGVRLIGDVCLPSQVNPVKTGRGSRQSVPQADSLCNPGRGPAGAPRPAGGGPARSNTPHTQRGSTRSGSWPRTPGGGTDTPRTWGGARTGTARAASTRGGPARSRSSGS